MRVLLVNYEYPPLGGGGGILTQSLVRHLARRADVVVLTSGTGGLPRQSEESGARIVRVPVLGRSERERSSSISLATFVPAAGLFGPRGLGGWSPDIVHAFFAIPSGLTGALVARRHRVPFILTLIGADVHDPSRRFSPDRFRPLGAIVRRVARAASAITAISTDVADRGQALTGRGNIEVIPCGIEPRELPEPSRAALGWAADDFVIVTTARLVARKAIDRLILAMDALSPNARLEIIGDGPELVALQQLASGIDRRIEFAGSLDDRQRDARLASADVYCQPSLHEGFGIAILEAMGYGLPAVVTDAGGPRDFVVDGENGFLVRPGDEHALASRLNDLAGDAVRRSRLAEAAREQAIRLSAESMTNAYAAVYESARRTPSGRTRP